MDLSRVAMVIGKNKLPVLGQARIAVVGLGGVGSYVAESLCRSGVGHLLLIDADKVAVPGSYQYLRQVQNRGCQTKIAGYQSGL